MQDESPSSRTTASPEQQTIEFGRGKNPQRLSLWRLQKRQERTLLVEQFLTLDRINPNGHYEPGNLRWATFNEQMLNRNSWTRGT